MGQIVDAKLHLVTILGQCGGDGHDPGIANEDVEACRNELLESVFDGIKRGEVDFDEHDVGALGHLLRSGNDLVGAFLVTTGKVDRLWVVLGQANNRGCTDTSSSYSKRKTQGMMDIGCSVRTSSHKDDLTSEVRQLFLRVPIEGHDELFAVVDDLGAQKVVVKGQGFQESNNAGDAR